MRIWLWFLGRGGGTIAEATVELTAVETSCFFPPICECSRCTAQLQICCHCRRTIYETVGWSKQLWVWRWLTKITPKIVRGPFGIIKQQKCGFYLICWIWNTVLLAPIGTVQKSKCSFSYSAHTITHFAKGSCDYMCTTNSITSPLSPTTDTLCTRFPESWGGVCVWREGKYGCSLNAVTTQFKTIQAF